MLRSLFILCAVAAMALLQACATTEAQDLASSFLSNSDSRAQAPKVPSRPKKRFSADNPAKILVIGDSLGVGIGIYLRQRAEILGLHAQIANRARTSTGLARRDYYDWPNALGTLVQSQEPDILVAHFGANDMQSIIRPDSRVILGTAGWEDAYRQEIRSILRHAADTGAMVYWLGPGPDRNTKLNRHLAYISTLYEDEARDSGATFLPISEFAATPDGGYLRTASVNGRNVAIRSGDGSHFTGLGYAFVVDQLLARMEQQVPSIFGRGDGLFAALQ